MSFVLLHRPFSSGPRSRKELTGHLLVRGTCEGETLKHASESGTSRENFVTCGKLEDQFFKYPAP
jgi:hypothetical protein